MSRVVEFELNGHSIANWDTKWSRLMPSIAETIEGAFSETFALGNAWKMNIDCNDHTYFIFRIAFIGIHKHASISIDIYGGDWDKMKREITETARRELYVALASNANEPGVVRIIQDYLEFEF